MKNKMKILILSVCIICLQICFGVDITKVGQKNPAGECGFEYGGPIIQQLTMPIAFPKNAHWSHDLQKLTFVDVPKHTVCIYDEKTGELTKMAIDKLKDEYFELFIPVKGNKNWYWLVTENQVIWVEFIYKDDVLSSYKLVDGQMVTEDKTLMVHRGRTDSKGRLIVGTQPTENSNRTNSDLIELNKEDPAEILVNKGSSSGVFYCKDYKVMFIIVQPKQLILKINYDVNTGTIDDSDAKVVFNASKFHDQVQGELIDAVSDTDEKIWIAFSATGAARGTLIKFNSDTQEIEYMMGLPVASVTGITFGGRKLNTLFVLTADFLKDPAKSPAAGAVFSISGLGATGIKHSDIVA